MQVILTKKEKEELVVKTAIQENKTIRRIAEMVHITQRYWGYY